MLRLDELGVLQPESGMKQHPLHLASCTHEGGVPCRQAAGPHIPSGLSKHKALEFGSGLSLPAGCILPALLAVCSHSRELPAHTLTAPTPTRASEAAKNHDSNGINPAGVQSVRSPPDPVGDGEGCGSSGPCSGAGGIHLHAGEAPVLLSPQHLLQRRFASRLSSHLPFSSTTSQIWHRGPVAQPSRAGGGRAQPAPSE